MFDSLKKYKKIIIGAVVLVALFIAYNTFFTGGSDDILVSESPSGVTSDVGRSLLATLLEVKSIRLDSSIFNDVGLQALEDFSQEVLPQQIGRPNPFLPIGINPATPEPTETISEEEPSEEEVTEEESATSTPDSE